MKEGERPKDMPEIVGGRYRVLTNLGQGAMGRVIKVEHLHTGEALAMKLLLAHQWRDARMVERFRREARALAQVRSEHVVRIIDADISPELDSAPYIVMELLHGEDLGQYAARRGRLDAQEVVFLLEQVARGLQRVHTAGLAHRDLKPANIFLHHQDDRLVVKLLDFGLVKPTSGGSALSNDLTQAGVIVGTPLFMSPEQVQGVADAVGPPTDIWSLGIIAFHLLTGRPYWNPSMLPRGVFDIGATALTPPSFLEPTLSVAFDSWFLRSCARNPSARWPDSQTQWRELARALRATATQPASFSSSAAAPAVTSGPPLLNQEATRPARPALWNVPTIVWPSGDQTGPVRQRRQVTVLFYRLVHGDQRTHHMDPEEFETLDIRLQTALDEALGDLLQTGSHLARGGRFVFFGYPVAYGDDARRAVEAALRLIDVTRGLDTQLRAEGRGSVRLRLGVHTGVVLTGNAELVGPALSVAAELEHQAAPGQLLVSAATWRLLGGRFRGERLGGPGEEALYVVLGTAGEAVSGTAAPMVGRNAELALLLSCLEQARYGNAQTVLISGEVGLGKSRLVQALRETTLAAQTPWLECRCSPYFQHTPFYPLVVLVKDLIQQAAGRTGQVTLGPSDIQAAVKALAFDVSLTPVVELLLSLPPTDPSVVEQWSPQLRRERTIETLVSLLHHRAAGSVPLVFVVEDLHWADPSTLEFLDRLSIVGGTHLLTVLTARLDFAPSWSSPSAITPIQLRRLPPPEAAQLIAQISGRDAAEDVVVQLVRRTDGIPLFIEEAARALAERSKLRPDEETKEERGGPSGDWPLIGAGPTTLRDALNARLDRLGTARGLAQVAAVLGPEFEVEDLRVLWSGDPLLFQTQLRELVRLKVLQPRGLPPHAAYTFQHALLSEAAYDSLPREARRDAHRQIAQALGSRTTGLAARPELLAHHFAEGGMAREAAGLLLKAGQAALRNSANAEARSHFQRGIDLLGKLEQTSADATLDITLRTLEGMTWVVSRGYAVPEVEQAFAGALARVRALKQEETPDLLPALWAQWQFLLVLGKFREAAESSNRLLCLADRFPDPGVAMLAHLSMGTALHGLGQFEEAVVHLEEGIRHYDPAAHAGYCYVYGQDPLMFGSVFEAWAVWCLGYPDRAAALADRALAHAERLRHPNSLGFALAISAIIRQYRGEAEEVTRLAQALLRLSTEQGWIQWMGHAQLWSGAADVLRGQVEKGVAAMREARQLARGAGEKAGCPHYDSVLIDGLCRAGMLDEAAARIAEAKEQLAASEQEAFGAELLRLEGEVARLRGDTEGARRLFDQALSSAAARKGRSYELRAALSLAQLERGQGAGGAQERARLARVLGAFTEGFDTADLRAARAEFDVEG